MSEKESSLDDPGKRKPDIDELLRDPELDDYDAIRLLRANMTWKEWIKNDFLRYWYAIGAFAFNIFIIFEPARVYHVSDAVGAIIIAIAFLTLCIGEFYLYKHIWPKGILSNK